MVYITAGGSQLQLDYRNLRDVLFSDEMRGVMAEAANALALELGARGVQRVWVDTYTTDRQAAAVTIPDYEMQGAEAKYGILSEAALALGLDVQKAAS